MAQGLLLPTNIYSYECEIVRFGRVAMEDPRIIIQYLYLAGNDGTLMNRCSSPLPGGCRFCRPATVRAPARSVVGGAGRQQQQQWMQRGLLAELIDPFSVCV